MFACINRTFPIRGFQIYDGPVHLTKCTFKNFVPTSDRFTSAVGFLMKNPWQMTPKNNISLVKFGPNVSLMQVSILQMAFFSSCYI